MESQRQREKVKIKKKLNKKKNKKKKRDTERDRKGGWVGGLSDVCGEGNLRQRQTQTGSDFLRIGAGSYRDGSG